MAYGSGSHPNSGMPIARRDARTLLRVVGELGELRHDSREWRTHLLERLCSYLGARTGMSITAPLPHIQFFDALQRRMISSGGHPVVGHGWTPAEHDVVLQLVRDYESCGDPMVPFMRANYGRFFTVTRQEVVADRDWYASDHVQEKRRPNDVDSFVMSHYYVPGYGWHMFGIHRAWGDRPFSERERSFVELLHGALGELWTRHGVTGGLPQRDHLSGQLRQVFDLLCRGLSEKEISAAMSLSPHTVHEYVKKLYRHFGVRGRHELLAQIINQARRQAAPVW
jgi:DNA-binding CsgD family transcriptional regulator